MYFDAAEAEMQLLADTQADHDNRLSALESQGTVDLAPILAEIADLQTQLAAAQAAIAQHENRLDAISSGAQG